MNTDDPRPPQPDAKKRRLSLFLRASLLSTLGVGLTLGVFAFAIISHEQRLLKDNLEGRARLLAFSIEESTANAIVGEAYESVVMQCLNMVNSGPDVQYVVITRKKDGFSLVHTKSPDTKYSWHEDHLDGFWQPSKEALDKSFFRESELVTQRVLHYSYPFSYSGIDGGWIHVGMGLDAYKAGLYDTYRIIGLLAAASLVMGVIVSFLFARHLTRPIFALQRFAHQVANGDYEDQVQVNTNDEIADLADSINRMTKNLVDSRDELASSLKRESQLREKEVLLKEIHHRVKNNMQILSSLLRIQSRGAENERISTILRESESRIRSMGLIHEKLYQSESISQIDFDAYVQTLTAELQRMYGVNGGKRIDIDVDVKDVTLGLDTALPCGLIINELVSNSFKYAFPNGNQGHISVRMSKLGEGRFELEVTDDGIGLPEDIASAANGRDPSRPSGRPGKSNSLGMRLVHMLADQLNGDVELSSSTENGGATARVHFVESEYKQRL